jgi:uncharacterized protein (TIGR03118 family)
MTQIARRSGCKHHRRCEIAALIAAAALAGACGGGGGSAGNMGTPLPPPSVTLAVQPASIVLGRSATLTWSSSSGSSCTASGAWSGAQAASGSATVTPAAVGTASYTLTCAGSGAYGGSATQTASLAVSAPTAFTATALVGDTAGGAQTVDAPLVNPWGVAFSPTSLAWVANNHSETSTLYDGNGVAQPKGAPLVVNLSSSAAGVSFDPTGIVYNSSTTDFVITAAGVSATATFLFAGEGGMIGGWSGSVDVADVIVTYVDAAGAVYKGLAIAKNGAGTFLYATDFHNGKIDVFDSAFARQAPSATAFAFTDPTLPSGYAPFGIQAINNGPGGATQLYVSYAQQALPDKHDNTNGAGLGLIDVYDTSGALVTHLVPAGGSLNAPWGMALAPSDFGSLSGALLVGNFGDGKINAFDAATGTAIGTVADTTGAAFAVPGLWGLAFGNDAHNQPHNTLFYAAGTNNEANGVYGRIDVGANPPTLNAAPVVTLTAPSGTVKGSVALSATATDALGISKVEFFRDTTISLGVATVAPYTVQWDSTTAADGSVSLTATATDPDGNVGTSAPVTVTVANTSPAATLTQIQGTVFTPICSGCHNGSNPPSGALPGSQDLSTAAKSFASLVNVASHELPALLRVKPGDPAGSYIIQKLEGAAGISGQRMPLGGPFLDQATIDQIKSWIAAGAANN